MYPATRRGIREFHGARHSRGFTLTELVMVFVIIAVLLTISYPGYRAQILKGRRAATQAYLLDLAQREGQYLLDARSYATSEAQLGYATTPVEVAPYYAIAITVPGGSPPTYTITATAIGGQASDSPTLSIDSLGTKLPSDKW